MVVRVTESGGDTVGRTMKATRVQQLSKIHWHFRAFGGLLPHPVQNSGEPVSWNGVQLSRPQN
jgi:hypothetical protein